MFERLKLSITIWMIVELILIQILFGVLQLSL